MSYLSSSETFRPYFCPPDLNNSPQWPHFSQLFAYANRMSYLLSVGRPAAAIAVYYPTTSGWLDDFSANTAALQIAQCLLEHQRDFDFVAEENLQSGLKLEAGAMTNQSGQQYRAVIIPPVKVISWKSLERLEEFAKQGGAVIVVGKLPELVAGRTYRDAAKGPTSLPWAKLATLADLEPVPEPSLPHARRGSPDPAAPADRRSPATIRDWLSSTPAPPPLPKPDLALEQASRGTTCPAVKYVHRRLADGEIYFLFNESARVLDLSVLLEGGGEPQYWDAVTGERRRPAAWRRDAGYVRLPLTLEPYQTRTIVLGPASSAPKDVQPALKETGESLVIEGDWTLAIAGRRLKGPLKSWSEYGEPSCSGSARYSKQFTLPQSLTDRKRVLYLDLGEVRYSARVVLNGKDLGALAWRPFRYAVGDAIRPGLNTIEIEITNTAANELAGDPERLAELERKGWLQNSYINRYLPFDKEMTPSGLLGPVRLAAYEAAK
jgi:hypothetical protein